MTRIFPARASLALAALPAALIAAWATPQTTMPADKPVLETQTVEIAPEKIEKPQQWVTAVEPKPLSDAATRGLTWLMEHQQSDGGWNQGEESQPMGGNAEQTAAKSNVGDTAAALLALMRSGSSPSDGPYAEAIRRGVKFLLGKVEASDPSNLSVTDVNGTRLQMKLGPNIDTFLASMVLTEASGHMPDQTSTNRVAAALDKVLYKIQVNQDDDGRWTGRGWAPALANSLAVEGSIKDNFTEDQRAAQVLHEQHVAMLGSQLFSRHLIAIELAGTLLLVALVGAVAMIVHSRAKRGQRHE